VVANQQPELIVVVFAAQRQAFSKSLAQKPKSAPVK